jgi:hypothetical protein
MFINEYAIPLETSALCSNDHIFDINGNKKCPKCESEHWMLITKVLGGISPYLKDHLQTTNR